MGAASVIRQLVGGMLFAAGVLIALLCGLCTSYFGIMSIGELMHARQPGDAFFLVIGVFATLIGVGLAWAGVAMMRK